jgi:hypothetical protein
MAREGRGRWLWAGLLLASIASAEPALAQGTGAPSTVQGAPASVAPERESAPEILYEAGIKAGIAGQLEKARALMLAAFKLNPSARIAASLGRIELGMGKPRDAAEHLTFCLRVARGITIKDRQKTEEMLAEAKAEIGTAIIKVDVAGGEVLVDGQTVGTAPLEAPVFVEVGNRRFEARKEGVRAANQQIEVTAGSTVTVELKLAGTGTAEAQGAPPPPPPPPPPRLNKAIVIGGASASGAALMAGVVFTKLANDRADQARAQANAISPGVCVSPTNACKKNARLYGESATFTNLAGWSFIGAGALGVATAVYAIVAKRTPPPSFRAVPVVTAQGGGFAVGGVW